MRPRRIAVNVRTLPSFPRCASIGAPLFPCPEFAPPMIGSRLGRFEITALIGKGGMGEVYRARDPQLDREVAIKVLPTETQTDPERLARFSREARTLAALHHPNIASLFGLEQDAERRFLVMELVEGEDLQQRLRRGPLPLDDALEIARQMTEALEEAHEKGIVHRDLKPANIMLTPAGKVKILDFGLARAMLGENVDESDLALSPTITAAMTAAGTVLGTAAYMSPEQARGKPVDRRADLWAFGVILWEMLSGKRLFEGETVSDTLAAVLRADPPWKDLPADTPPAVRRLLARCLERDPRQRLRDIGEARVRLERWRDDPSSLHLDESTMSMPAARARTGSSFVPWVVALVAATVAVVAWLRPSEPSRPQPPRLRFDIDLPKADPVRSNVGPHSAISPDGSMIAYLSDNSIRLRALDDPQVRNVPGSEFSGSLTFSPSGQWLAFHNDGAIRRVSVTGGSPLDVCEVGDPRGLTWLDESRIVFTPSYFTGLSIVSLETGEVRALTALDSTRGERSHRWPSALPDGRSILFMSQRTGQNYEDGEIEIVDVETGEREVVYRGGAFPRYAPTGHLVLARNGALVAVGFDPGTRRTNGFAVPVLEGLHTLVGSQESDDGSAQVSWSNDGVMLYRRAVGGSSLRPAWLDLESGSIEIFGEAGEYFAPVISPDGRTLAISRATEGFEVLYLIDTATGIARRFGEVDVFDRPGGWSADSRTLYWDRMRENRSALLRRPLDGTRPAEVLFESDQVMTLCDVSPDESLALVMVWADGDAWDLALLDLREPDKRLRYVADGPGVQAAYGFSPDGRWFTMYDNTGRALRREVYVVSVEDPSLRWAVLASTGEPPKLHWSGDQQSLVLRLPEKQSIVRLPLEIGDQGLRLGRLETLVADDYAYVREFIMSDLLPDGRMVVLTRDGGRPGADEGSGFVLDTTWFDELRRRVPTTR